jgi:predicted PurR-regulated permease PerM
VPAGDPEIRTVDLDPRSVVVVMAAFVALVALTGLARSAPRTVTWFLLGSLLALALDPVIRQAQRLLNTRRSVAVAVVLMVLAALFAILAAVLVPSAVRQAGDLGDEIPQVVEDLGNLPLIGETLRDNNVPENVQEWIEDLPDRLTGADSPVDDVIRSFMGGALAAVATLLVATTLLLDAERLALRARAFVPRRHRDRVGRFAAIGYRVVGRYFAGSVLVATIAGLTVLVAGLTLGLPLTPLVAVWVAVFDLVPQIGGAVGGIPFVALGFTQGALIGLVCAVGFILYLQFENHILSPLVVGQAVDLSPPATMTAALIGVSAAGVVGAMVAVPLLGAAKAFYLEIRPAPSDPAPVAFSDGLPGGRTSARRHLRRRHGDEPPRS